MLATMMKKMQRFGTSLVFGGSLLAVGAGMDGCGQMLQSFEKGFAIGQQLRSEFDAASSSESDWSSSDDSSYFEDDSYYGEDDSYFGDWGYDSYGEDYWW